MRIRFFNTYEPVTSLYRDLIPLLVDKGARVDVVVSRGRYRQGRDIEQALGHLSGVKVIQTVNFGRHSYQGLAAKLVVSLGYLVHASLYALFGPRVDQNVFLTQPPFFPLLGVILQIMRGQSFAVILMDLQPDLSIVLGIMNPRRVWTRFLSWSTRITLRKASSVIVIGRCMARYVEGLGVEPEHIRLIPNWADERQIFPVDPAANQLRREYSWGDRFVVVYAGNVGLVQHFEDILTVAERLQDRSDILFVFIGEGGRRQWLDRQLESRRLPNAVSFDFLHDRFPLSDILAAADVHLVPLKPVCTGIVVPSKTYGILAAGRPLVFIGNSECEIARVIDEEDVGTVLAYGDAEGLRRAILNYAENPAERRRQGRNARALAEEKYSRSRALDRYLEVLLGPTR